MAVRSTKQHYYNTEEIVACMESLYSDFIDGYNCLDTDGLLRAAVKELRADTGVPVEFEVACKRIEILHREQQ